jgi:hypothetical protein
MSSLWTPDGERPVGRPSSGPTPNERAVPTDRAVPTNRGEPGDQAEPTEEELARLRRQLADTPAALVVTNHVFGLFELAALHLSLTPPQLEEARLAIDGAAALIEGLAGRLGEAEPTAQEGLAQLRLAFVQIKAADAERG